MTNHQQSYGFKFKGDYQQRIASIHSIGKETQTSTHYQWDGLKRNETGKVVFQYTLKGEGAIRIDDTTIALKAHDAFIVPLPSHHCYYLPETSDGWSFVYITLYGDEAVKLLTDAIEKYGHIHALKRESRPIQYLFYLLDTLSSTGMSYGYELSRHAYTYLMELMQYIEHDQAQDTELPQAIAKAVTFIESHFDQDLALSDMVAVSGLSTYYFTRLFHQTMGETPIKYLTKVRLNEALTLLQDETLTIEDIASRVGFHDANYFSKVFKKALDIPPSKYRNSRSFMPVNQLFLD